MQQLQTQLLQLRTEMLNQKAIKTQMLEFCKQASKKNEDSAEDEDEDDEDEEKVEHQKSKKEGNPAGKHAKKTDTKKGLFNKLFKDKKD